MAAPASSGKVDSKNIIYQGKPACCGAFGDWCHKTRWLITTSFIQRERGICCVDIDNLELIRVKDMTFKGCCCCCGTITVFSSDQSTPTLLISGIPNGMDVYHKLRDAVTAIHQGTRVDLQMQ